MTLTREDVLRLVHEHDIQFVRLQFVDIFGVLKNVAITADELERALDGKVMFDGSSVEGFTGIEESDMYLVPDPATFTIFPWRGREGAVGRLICDIYNPDGTPFAGCPRFCLKRALRRAEELGYEVQVGPEVEFFLFHYEGENPTLKTHDRAGYFDLAPTDLGEDARREIVLTLKEMGYAVEASHHEAAPGQHEVDLKYLPALAAADLIATFRFVVRAVAHRRGLHATFMPKPLADQNGSGVHLNFSLLRERRNVFADPGGEHGLSREALSFIAGLLRRAREFTAVTNPTVNSYKRFVPGYEAPVYVAWGTGNRSLLVRVPAARGADTRVELRSPDPTCNPYLALAVAVEAGLEGIAAGAQPGGPVQENLYLLTPEERAARGVEELPRSLGAALAAMRASSFVRGVLGDHIFQKFLAAKEEEWEAYSRAVHAWEIERYLARF